MFRRIIFWGVVLFCAGWFQIASAQSTIEINLQFSTDNGKTYSLDFPVVSRPQEILVKQEWSLDEPREIWENMSVISLYRKNEDFASAVNGEFKVADNVIGYRQAPAKNWFDLGSEGCVYRIDLRERPEGVMGYMNKWLPEKNARASAPLPYCPALKPGVHKFSVTVTYTINETRQTVRAEKEFSVTITGDEKTDVAAKSAAPSKDKTATVQTTPVLPEVKGDYVFDRKNLAVLAGSPELALDGELFVRTKVNQEIGWKVQGIKEGEYYLRMLTLSGYTNTVGAEYEIGKARPYMFLNGKLIVFDRSGEPIPYRETEYVSLIQTETPVFVKNGDELRWTASGWRAGKLVGPLALLSSKPERLPVWIPEVRDPYLLEDYFRIESTFQFPESPAQPALLNFAVRNVKNAQDRFRIKVSVLDYFQKEAAFFSQEVALDNRQAFEKTIPFAWGNSDRYRAIIRVEDSAGHSREEVKEYLTDAPLAFRQKIWLNKDWEVSGITDDGTLKTRTIGEPRDFSGKETWRKVDLPWQFVRYGWTDNQNQHVAWYRKKVVVPAEFSQKRCFIRFSRVSYECRVFVNGQEAGYHFGPVGPFELEMTGRLKPGAENEILIGVRDFLAALEPAELNRQKLDFSYWGLSLNKFRSTIFRDAGIDETWLYTTETNPIQDVFVKTSYRQKKIDLEIALPKIDSPAGCRISNRVYWKGKEVLSFPDQPVKSGEKKLQLSRNWSNPILWGPQEFNLLRLVTELKAADGKILDRLETRFGFREVWPDGTRLYWNGARAKFAAVSIGGSDNKRTDTRDYVRSIKLLSANMHRHVGAPESWSDICDEEGLVFAQDTKGVYGYVKQIFDSDEYWRNEIKSNRELVAGLKNHPSIVEWYLSNESRAADFPDRAERLKLLGEDVLKNDATRIIEFGSDLDLSGLSQIISTHYPIDQSGLQNPPNYLPELAYWRYFEDNFTPGMKIPAGQERKIANLTGDSRITYGFKPIVLNENSCYMAFYQAPDGMTRLVSDWVYESPWALEEAGQQTTAWFCRGHRDVESSVITPWEVALRNPLQRELPAVDINPLQQCNKFYGGTKVTYDINLHRDIFNSADLIFEWTLSQGRNILQSARKNPTFESCELKREKVTLNLPQVGAEQNLSWNLVLRDKAAVLKEVRFPITVYPRVKFESPSGTYLFDPSGDTAGILGKLGVVLPKAAAAETIRKAEILVIGRNQAASPEIIGLRYAVLDFVRSGGRLLVLNQDKTPVCLPLDLVPTQVVSSINFTFRPGHPLVKRFSEDEFNFWYPEHKSISRLYAKPGSGNYRTLVEAGFGRKGFSYVGLVEIPYGKGLFLCSQFDLLENAVDNPAAAKLWNNMLAYLSAKPQPLQKAGFIGSEGKLKDCLAQQAVQFEPVNAAQGIAAGRTIILEGNAVLTSAETDNLAKFVRDGGKLLVHRITPQNRSAAEKICGAELTLSPVYSPSWTGRAIRIRTDSLTEGLTNYDLFWKRRTDTEDYPRTYYRPENIVAPLADWQVKCSGGVSLLFPSLLVKVPVGKGLVLLDNLNWDETAIGTLTYRKRIAAVLLTNLGVNMFSDQPEKLPEAAVVPAEPVRPAPVEAKPFVPAPARKPDSEADIRFARNLNAEANVLLKQARLSEAEYILKRALEAAPAFQDSYINLGYLYEEMKSPDAAIEIYQKLLVINPKNLDVLRRLGNLWEEKGEWARAAEIYQRSMDVDTNQPEIKNALDNARLKASQK